MIKKLRNINNGWVEGNDNLNPLICDYFGNLFKSDSAEINQELMHAVKPRVSSSMNRLLIAPYSRDEVRKALF